MNNVVCGFCKQNTGRNVSNSLMKCQDRNESPQSPCWRASDILLDNNNGFFNHNATDEMRREAYERACFELQRHRSLTRFRRAGESWREPRNRAKLDQEWKEEKVRRALELARLSREVVQLAFVARDNGAFPKRLAVEVDALIEKLDDLEALERAWHRR